VHSARIVALAKLRPTLLRLTSTKVYLTGVALVYENMRRGSICVVVVTRPTLHAGKLVNRRIHIVVRSGSHYLQCSVCSS